MTDDNQTELATRQAIAAKGRSGKLTVSGKLKVAIDLMLYGDGTAAGPSRRADAATAAGMTDHGLREAFRKPHVRAYYHAGLEILRTSERARNIFALASVRETSGNDVARVSAAKTLEQLAEPNGPGGPGGGRSGARSGWCIDLSDDNPRAGVVIIIGPREPQPAAQIIDITPSEVDRH
jgi:hypothetical protein